MPAPSTIVKYIFIISASALTAFFPETAVDRAWQLAAGAGAIYVLWLLIGRLRLLFISGSVFRRVPSAAESLGSLFLFYCALILLFLLRMSFEKRPNEPPDIWFSLSERAEPVYDLRLSVQGKIARVISPGLYLAEIQLLRTDERVIINTDMPYSRRSSQQSKSTNHRRQSQRTRHRIRASAGHDGYETRRRRSPNNSGKTGARRFQYTWKVQEPQTVNFLTALSFRERPLEEGCTFHLFASGRAVPQRLGNSSFHTYLRKKGAATYLWSGRDHLIFECGETGWKASVRTKMRQILESRLDGRRLQTALGFIFGQTGFMDRDYKKQAKELGILHIFAASGLHLAVIYSLLYYPLSLLLGKKHPLSLFFPLPACAAYLWLLDFPVSLSRAFVFLFLYSLRSLIHRRVTTDEHIANTCILLLFIMPGDFCSLSGALSTGAVAGIVLFHPIFMKTIFNYENRIFRWFSSQAAVCISATVFTAPLLLFVFQTYSFSGPLVNLWMVPLSEPVLPLLLLTVGLELAGIHSAFLLDPFWKVNTWFLDIFCESTAALSPYSLYFEYRSPWSFPLMILIVLFLLLSLLLYAEKRSSAGRIIMIRKLIIFIIFFLGPAGAAISIYFSSGSSVPFEFFGNSQFDFSGLTMGMRLAQSLLTDGR